MPTRVRAVSSSGPEETVGRNGEVVDRLIVGGGPAQESRAPLRGRVIPGGSAGATRKVHASVVSSRPRSSLPFTRQ